MNISDSLSRTGPASNLRAGEWVEVISADEILATLDDRQTVGGLPFMPEMLQYCGRRFRVYKSAHKTCDTIEAYVIRRMDRTVHLEGLRCDGEAHGGCQAGCLLFWKEAWLKRVPHDDSLSISDDAQGVTHRGQGSTASHGGLDALFQATRVPSDEEGERYRCQATTLLEATTEVRRRDRWDPRFYFKDLTSGNVRLRDFIWYGAIAVLNSFMLQWGGRRHPDVRGLAGEKTPTGALNLKPGDVVQVRSKDEIMRTLNANQRNRGLSFDVEMVPYCENGSFRVLRRVEKIINEKTGRMMTLPNPCVILDGVTCSGNLSFCRMFCPRAIHQYWREIWLKPSE